MLLLERGSEANKLFGLTEVLRLLAYQSISGGLLC